MGVYWVYERVYWRVQPAYEWVEWVHQQQWVCGRRSGILAVTAGQPAGTAHTRAVRKGTPTVHPVFDRIERICQQVQWSGKRRYNSGTASVCACREGIPMVTADI